MEIPEKISFGGKQRVAVQNLIGGGRVVNVLGIDNSDIKFSGMFTGGDAASRAELVDGLRESGVPVPLSWGGFYYTVIVRQFLAEYRKQNLIPFSIVCVVADQVSSAVSVVASAADLVAADLTTAVSFCGTAGVAFSAASLTDSDTFAALTSQISTAVATTGTTLEGATVEFSDAPDVASAVSAMFTLSAASGQLAAQTAMAGYVNRAFVNFSSDLP
jgi:hypothetical protein